MVGNSFQEFKYRRFGKRMFDLVLVVPSLIMAAPLFIVVWFCSRLIIGRPVLFKQARAGFRGVPFVLYKFRTMTDARDEAGDLLPDSLRLNSYGRFLRSTSIDELPALWNVLRGELSLIGPRPLLVEYVALYNAEQSRRLEVLPGMAGYAALHGRNAQSWEDIFQADLWYVDHFSFMLDLQIMGGIFRVVFSREGIDRGTHNSNSDFQKRIDAINRERNCKPGA